MLCQFIIIIISWVVYLMNLIWIQNVCYGYMAPLPHGSRLSSSTNLDCWWEKDLAIGSYQASHSTGRSFAVYDISNSDIRDICVTFMYLYLLLLLHFWLAQATQNQTLENQEPAFTLSKYMLLWESATFINFILLIDLGPSTCIFNHYFEAVLSAKECPHAFSKQYI